MKKEWFLWVTIVILLIANFVLLYQLNKSQNNANSYKFEDSYIQAVMDNASLHMLVDGVNLSDITLYQHIKKKNFKQLQDTCNFHNLLQGDKVLFYFPKTYCDGCISEQLLQLNKLGKNIGYENIIILTDQVIQKHADYILYNNIKPEVYETKEENIGFQFPQRNGESLPVLMIVDNDRVVTSFVISTETMEYTKCFFNMVNIKFAKEETRKDV